MRRARLCMNRIAIARPRAAIFRDQRASLDNMKDGLEGVPVPVEKSFGSLEASQRESANAEPASEDALTNLCGPCADEKLKGINDALVMQLKAFAGAIKYLDISIIVMQQLCNERVCNVLDESGNGFVPLLPEAVIDKLDVGIDAHERRSWHLRICLVGKGLERHQFVQPKSRTHHAIITKSQQQVAKFVCSASLTMAKGAAHKADKDVVMTSLDRVSVKALWVVTTNKMFSK